ncbi:hypothetical protein [Parafrankia sp. Ea1.12]|uniref:hypothetical protein n=1 Tax=Parafrankia sp. Ea1.12 TaxID=573499 RepID=UPI0011BE83BA|nr:hypothetical protein [Parafrankia sp. Ea1.12]
MVGAWYCPDCKARRGMRPGPTTTSRGYGHEHRKTREKLLPAAVGSTCTRCHRPIVEGQDVHLDHTDDRTGYNGLAHDHCNVVAGARKGAARSHGRAYTSPRIPEPPLAPVLGSCGPGHVTCWHGRQWTPDYAPTNPDGSARTPCPDALASWFPTTTKKRR